MEIKYVMEYLSEISSRSDKIRVEFFYSCIVGKIIYP